MKTPLPKKLGMKPGMRACIIDPPAGYLKLLQPLPENFRISSTLDGKYIFMQVFVTRLSDVGKLAKKLTKHVEPNALVWVSYPKKTSKADTNLGRDEISEEMHSYGWDTVAIVAIDEVWSALRFRPKGEVGSRSRRAGV